MPYVATLITIAVVLWTSAAQADDSDKPCQDPGAPTALPAERQEVVYPFLARRGRGAADLLLEDRWKAGRQGPALLPLPLCWDEDPYGERYWRFEFYGLRPLIPLLEIYLATGEVRYRAKLLAILEDFVAHAPCQPGRGRAAEFLFDKHTAANRLLALTAIYFGLARRGDLDQSGALAASLRARIGALGRFFAEEAHFESHNNHGFAESTALLLAAVMFPDWDESDRWLAIARRRFESLVSRLIGTDGVFIENSPFYHFYVYQQLRNVVAWARRYGIALPENVPKRTSQMIDFLGAIVHPDGTLPPLAISSRNSLRRQLTETIDAVSAEDPVAAWLISGGAAGQPPPPRPRHFGDSGLIVLRSYAPTPKAFAGSAHLVLDAGPARTSRPHLDVGNLVLWGGGRMLLNEAGSYSLEPSVWYDYFYGTRGHNTVIVDGQDQRRGSGRVISVAGDAETSITAVEHGLYEGVTHHRTAALIGAELLVVVDELSSRAGHHFDLVWHLAEDLTGEAHGLLLTAREQNGRAVLRAVATGGEAFELARGMVRPRDGWYATSYERLVPATAVHLRARGSRVRFVTAFAWGGRVEHPLMLSTERGVIAVSAGVDSWRVDPLGPTLSRR